MKKSITQLKQQHSDRQTEARQTIEYPNGNEKQRIEEFSDLPIGILPKPRKHITEDVAVD